MRCMSIAAGALLVLMNTSCGGGGGGVWGPTEKDIVDSLQETIRSVSGDWSGITAGNNPTNPVQLQFKLTEGSNGQVTGTGTMKEKNATSAVPITVTGTWQRPNLTLAFQGMVYESKQVQGSFQGEYTTVGGILAPLKLTAPGFTRDLQFLLQEKL